MAQQGGPHHPGVVAQGGLLQPGGVGLVEGTLVHQLAQGVQQQVVLGVADAAPQTDDLRLEDIDEVALSYAEIKALATDNPYIQEKMELDIQVSKLQLLKQSFLNQKYEMEDKVMKTFPKMIREQEIKIVQYEADIEQVKAHTPSERGVSNHEDWGHSLYREKGGRAGNHRSL